MITWILGIILIIWVIIKRCGKEGKIKGEPLGMPRGTIRALNTLLIVTIPFHYLFVGENIPGMITNSILFLMAFYFQTRKSGKEKLKHIVKYVKNPELLDQEEEPPKHPLYLPKFTVRISLVVILSAIIIINHFGSTVSFESTNALLDILIIISSYIVGVFFRNISVSKEKKRLKKQIVEIKNYQSLSKYEIIEKLIDQEPAWLKQKSRNFLSLLTLATVITSLMLFTIPWDYEFQILTLFTFSLREALLLLINVYYGFRD
jgi:hypothetical protein